MSTFLVKEFLQPASSNLRFPFPFEDAAKPMQDGPSMQLAT
jgi:hypothetical protein